MNGQAAVNLLAKLFPKWRGDLVETVDGQPKASELACLWRDTIDRYLRNGVEWAQVEAVCKRHRVERSGIAPDLKTVDGRLSELLRASKAPSQFRAAITPAMPAGPACEGLPPDIVALIDENYAKGVHWTRSVRQLNEYVEKKYGGWDKARASFRS